MRFTIERELGHHRYFWAGICVTLFLMAQLFQEIAFRFWIATPSDRSEELLTYLNPADKARALAVGGGIVVLLVPYVVLAFRYLRSRPLLSVLGFLSGMAFVGFEVVHRSLDFFVVGGIWAHQLQSAGDSAAGKIVLNKFAVWSEGVHGWYFPLLMAHLLASCAFAAITASEWRRGGWFRLAPTAFLMNAVRLLGRTLSMYGGWAWLNPLNDQLYFPAVFVINAMLASWFFFLARRGDEGDASAGVQEQRFERLGGRGRPPLHRYSE